MAGEDVSTLDLDPFFFLFVLDEEKNLEYLAFKFLCGREHHLLEAKGSE